MKTVSYSHTINAVHVLLWDTQYILINCQSFSLAKGPIHYILLMSIKERDHWLAKMKISGQKYKRKYKISESMQLQVPSKSIFSLVSGVLYKVNIPTCIFKKYFFF